MALLTQDRKITGTLGAAQDKVVVNAAGLATVTFQIPTGLTGTVTFEATNDDAASPSLVAIPATNVATGARATTAVNPAGIYRVDASGLRTVQARVSAYTSGSTAVIANGSSAPFADPSGVTVTGSSTVDTELPAAAALSDATANPTAPMVGAANMGWDGTNWERNVLIAGGDAKNNALVGMISGAFNYVFNGTTWDRVRSATADALAATGLLALGNMIWNGATWDRMQGDGQKQARVVAAGYTAVVSATLTRPANTTAYTAGDEITDTGGAVRTLTSIARYSGGTGTIQGLMLIFSDNWAVKPTIRAYIFDTTSTPQTDNAAFAPSDAELATAIGTVDLNVANAADATGSTGNMTMDSGLINLPFACVGSANLFIRFQITNAGQAGANSGTITVRARVGCD